MKLLKISVLALVSGLFVASCGSNSSQTDRTDSTTISTTTTEVPVTTPPVTDTAVAPPATPVDSMAH